jgi:hypothetical protein
MLRSLLARLGELLLPERYDNHQTIPKEPIEALTLVYNQLLQLAAQIEAHAEIAPYPHVTLRLRTVAAEKRESAQQLRNLIERRGASVREPGVIAVVAKNHWERVRRDLADQKTLENFLALSEPRLSAEDPEVAEFLLRLMAAQVPHRDALAALIAVADPQATQT